MTDEKQAKMVTLDCETSVKCDIGTNNRPSPFYPKNKIVLIGSSTLDLDCKERDFEDRYHLIKGPTINPEGTLKHSNYNLTRLVGHNLKFDLHYICKTVHQARNDLISIDVWDTQIVEYILSGQQNKFAKLDELAPEYGGTTKIDKVKELWDAGVDTEDIDEDLLAEYLEGDVRNTELIALAQMAKAVDRDQLPLIETQMDAMKAVQEMEYNGMYIDRKELRELYHSLNTIKNNLRSVIETELSIWHPEIPSSNRHLINIDSPKVLSILLFGGELKYKEKELVGKYKNGNDKYKQVEHILRVHSIFGYDSDWVTPAGAISTSDSVLEGLISKAKTPTGKQLVKNLQQYRKVSKELSTYVEAIEKLIYPDGCIHGHLHQASTDTGRLSSSQPNLQNMPSSEESGIKRIFTSRFDDGVIIEADYKQLEVICLAFLSQDKQLIADIINGKDIHIETGKRVFGSTLTKDQRRIVKTINFGLIYGGKATALAKQAGVDKQLAQECINAFYTRYPGVKQWQEDTFEEVKAARVYTGRMSKKGYPAGESYYKSCTGRVYVFKEYDKPDWMTWEKSNVVFRPQETRNYPVQGLATGDIVPMMLGVLYHVLKNDSILKDRCLMVNTVHDSIIFDCKSDVMLHAASVIKETLENAPKYLKSKLNLDFNLPLKAEITIGRNWKDQKEG